MPDERFDSVSKYSRLTAFLVAHPGSLLTMSFVQIEMILGTTLPDSAKKYPAFWSKGNHVGRELGAAGWEAAPQFGLHQLEFRRIGTPPRRPDPPKIESTARDPAQSVPEIVLVGCVKKKREGQHRAEYLYVSTLFADRASYARSTGKPWFVLSSEYGLLAPDEIIDTYDVALKSLTTKERRVWSQRVLEQIDQKIGAVHGKIVEIHAGNAYRDYGVAQGLVARGAKVSVPLEHLRQGEQLAWYSRYQDKPPRLIRARHTSREPIVSASELPSSRVMEIVDQLTDVFMSNRLDLSARSNAKVCPRSPMRDICALQEFRIRNSESS
jgi:hypothetical protein